MVLSLVQCFVIWYIEVERLRGLRWFKDKLRADDVQ